MKILIYGLSIFASQLNALEISGGNSCIVNYTEDGEKQYVALDADCEDVSDEICRQANICDIYIHGKDE